MSYGKLLTAASALGTKVSATNRYGEDTLGVMLPNANGAAATVLGLMSAGKVPAMINFTAGPASILAGCRAARGAHRAYVAGSSSSRRNSGAWSMN